MIQIFVKLPEGNTLAINAELDWTVGQFHDAVAENAQVTVESFRLIGYGIGATPSDMSKKLTDFIDHEAICKSPNFILAENRIPPTAPVAKICIKTSSDKVFFINTISDWTVKQLKQVVAEKIGVHVECVQLIYKHSKNDNSILLKGDEEKLSACHIPYDAEIHCIISSQHTNVKLSGCEEPLAKFETENNLQQMSPVDTPGGDPEFARYFCQRYNEDYNSTLDWNTSPDEVSKQWLTLDPFFRSVYYESYQEEIKVEQNSLVLGPASFFPQVVAALPVKDNRVEKKITNTGSWHPV